MKALIIHGTGGDHEENWFPWLKGELEKLGHSVWVPDMPVANKPDVERWSKYLLENNPDFNDWLVIGHSAGAVEVLDLLQKLPEGQRLRAAIFVAVFQGDLGWDKLKDLAGVRYDYQIINQNASKKIVIHSEDDPHCPINGAREIAGRIDADFIEMHGMQH